MFFADPISKMNSNQVGDPTEGVLYNLDSPFRDKVVPDKGVMEVSALDNFPIRHIDEDELVEEHFPHDERCTVGHHIGSGMSSYLINIIAVQDFAALDLHFIFDDDSGAVITFADDEIAEIVSTRSPQEACVHLVELAKSRGGYDNITLAVLPLGGRLHEEVPAGARQAPKKGTAASVKKLRKRRKLTKGQQVVIMMMLALLGCLFAALFVLFRMSA